MMRMLFWLALLVLVVLAIRSKFKSVQPPGQAGPGAQPRARGQKQIEAEAMLECAHCGVYYPASETVQARGRNYCSDAHASQP